MAMFLVPRDGQGRPVVIDRAIVLVGRQADCDVVLTHSRRVSRRHCCIVQINEDYVVRDLGSMNGVRVNGERIDREAPIAIGDVVSIGDLEFVLQSKQGVQGRLANGAIREAEPNGRIGRRGLKQPKSKGSEKPSDISQDFPVPISESDLPVDQRSDENESPGDSSYESSAESGLLRDSDNPQWNDSDEFLESHAGQHP